MKNESEPKRQKRPYVAPRIERRRALGHAVLFSATSGTVGIATTGTVGIATTGTTATSGTATVG